MLTELQQGLGMTYHPRAILLDRALDDIIDPVGVYVHDWMHGIFVDGVANLLVFLLLEEFIRLGYGNIYGQFKQFAGKYRWPYKHHRPKRHEIFDDSKKNKIISG